MPAATKSTEVAAELDEPVEEEDAYDESFEMDEPVDDETETVAPAQV